MTKPLAVAVATATVTGGVGTLLFGSAYVVRHPLGAVRVLLIGVNFLVGTIAAVFIAVIWTWLYKQARGDGR